MTPAGFHRTPRPPSPAARATPPGPPPQSPTIRAPSRTPRVAETKAWGVGFPTSDRHPHQSPAVGSVRSLFSPLSVHSTRDPKRLSLFLSFRSIYSLDFVTSSFTFFAIFVYSFAEPISLWVLRSISFNFTSLNRCRGSRDRVFPFAPFAPPLPTHTHKKDASCVVGDPSLALRGRRRLSSPTSISRVPTLPWKRPQTKGPSASLPYVCDLYPSSICPNHPPGPVHRRRQDPARPDGTGQGFIVSRSIRVPRLGPVRRWVECLGILLGLHLHTKGVKCLQRRPRVSPAGEWAPVCP